MARSKALDALLNKGKNKYYSEVELDDLTSAINSIDKIDNAPVDEPSSKSKNKPTDDIPSLELDLNISDELNNIKPSTDMDEISSIDSKEMDFEDIGEIPDLDLGELDDEMTTPTDDIAAMPDADLDGMINSLGGLDDTGLEDNGNEDVSVSDQEDGPDDDIGIDDDIATDESAVAALSPEDELKRKNQCINIMKKIYETYRDKVNRFKELQLPYDKERIYKPIFDKYIKVFDLLSEYILKEMKKDESFKLMRRIVDFNTLFTILDHRLKMVNDWIQQMKK